MKIKCAVFDFDGTLYDSMPIWNDAAKLYLKSVRMEPKPTLREDVRTLSLAQTACFFRKEYGLKLPEEEIMQGINKTVEHFYLYEAMPKPGAASFLRQLEDAGIRMCVATATDRYLIEEALRRCGMDRWFDTLFTCSEVGHGKEEPDIFRAAMEYFGADRGSTVVFEDALHAARTAVTDGFTVAAVYDPSEPGQDALRELADCFIPDFEHTEDFWKLASDE